MPTYGYQCTRCNEQFEVLQRITEEPLTTHEGCGGELRKLVYPVGILFKGPGFYVNDYARNGTGKPATAANGASTEKTETPAASAPAKSDSAPAAATGSKPVETKAPATAAK